VAIDLDLLRNATIDSFPRASSVIESHPARTLIFGLFQVDIQLGELRKAGIKIKLQQKPFQILELLLEHPGEPVTREELRRKLWPADTFIDFDHSVATAIRKLRQALGDSANNPRFIETMAHGGYRFIAPISELPEYSMRPLESSQTAFADGRIPRQRDLGIQKDWFLGSLAVVAILLVGIAAGRHWPWPGVQPGASRPIRIQSIAVLPFESLSEDPHQEYFAEGITDALITDLAKIGSLRVISRTSVMRYSKTRKPLAEIAQELKVEAVLEGTIRRSRDHIRIGAQFVEIASDKHLWADAYEDAYDEHHMRDELALEAQVARAIANEIQLKLRQQQKSTASN
jgi:TolB-like protein/DNA-binding winged helix-turn-helix (wHTH) protein